MRRLGAALLVLGLVGCSGGGEPPDAVPNTPAPAPTFPAPATTPLDPAKAKTLQTVLARVIEFPDSPFGSRGVTAAVVTDQWTWSGAAGRDALGTPLTPRTSMGVASITKTFVAAEVMLLAKAGKVELDKPIAEYLKHRLTANNATVRQHLSMTSGVPDYAADEYVQLEKAVGAAPSKHWTIEQALEFATGPVGAPNSPFHYSNVNYALLGLMIETVTGEPLATVLRRDLATPAGLQHAAFQDAEKPQPPKVVDVNYECLKVDDGYLPCRAFASLIAPSGGLAADAPTVARWGYQLYGGRVVPADLVGEMTKGDGEYGLGTDLFTEIFGIGTAYGHYGDLPDHSSALVVIPREKVSIALLLTDGGRKVDRVVSDLTKALQPLLS